MSLIQYLYFHNNPLVYWDPTGHIQKGDEILSPEAQAKIIVLTDAWYAAGEKKGATAAEIKKERDAIQAEANRVREADKKLTTAQKNSTAVAAEASVTTKAIMNDSLSVINTQGSLSTSSWELIKTINSLHTWTEPGKVSSSFNPSTGVTSTSSPTIYNGAFGHSTVSATISQIVDTGRGKTTTSWGASTSTRLELSKGETLFVGSLVAGYDSGALGVQLNLAQALKVLNTANASYYNKLKSGSLPLPGTEFISPDTLKKIISASDIGLSDGFFGTYDFYVSYVNLEYGASLKGATLQEHAIQANLAHYTQVAITALSLYQMVGNTPSGNNLAKDAEISRLDMIEYNLMKYGYVPLDRYLTPAITSEVGSKNVANVLSRIKEFLGADVRVITNKSRDKVFLSDDGTKRVRFDINNPAPHENVHMHVEELVNDQWIKSGSIYPINVPNK